MNLNYHSLCKVIERPDDGYREPVERKNNLLYLAFTSCGHLSTSQLRTIPPNLSHPSVETQMKVIEMTGIQDPPKDTRKELIVIVKHCGACQGHGRIGIIEKSYAYLRNLYENAPLELPDISRDDRLSLIFRAVNDAPIPETGISPTM